MRYSDVNVRAPYPFCPMVSVVHALPDSGIDQVTLERLIAGLPEDGAQKLLLAVTQASEIYGDRKVGSGETAFGHGLGAALILAALNLDLDSRLAALLFAVPEFVEQAREKLAAQWGAPTAELVDGLYRLKQLRPLTLASTQNAQGVQAQAEVLRKMLLALAADLRVVMIRLASRTQTLRYLTDRDTPERVEIARESLEIYAPLANRQIGRAHV
jgi:GTP pyrophosphokinase